MISSSSMTSSSLTSSSDACSSTSFSGCSSGVKKLSKDCAVSCMFVCKPVGFALLVIIIP
ncbi:MAG: hypothetical protein CMI60_00435 [Parvibaculum sp.]|nr:hypothetical protein [Parvibaculum sp.]